MTASRPGSIGIMGGTFDPIHIGHLAIAEEARDSLGLERILFVPSGRPPHKPAGSSAPAEERVAMVELAIRGNPAFALSRLEIDRPGPSYTADTLAALSEAEGAAGRAPDLTLILSAETLRELPTWHEPRRLLGLARLAVVPREGYPAPDPGWLAEQFPGQEDRVDFLEGPRLGLSSTALRARVAAGRSIRYLVPEPVAGYIAEHGLDLSALTGDARPLPIRPRSSSPTAAPTACLAGAPA